jgi:ERCC4-type nuclease
MPIVLDDREHALRALVADHACRRLTVADALITEPDSDRVAFAIERKTLADLRASLDDGRFAEQRFRLVEAFGRERVGYVIEGVVGDEDVQCRGAVLSLQLRDRLCVIRTADASDTASVLVKLDALAAEGRCQEREGGPPPAVSRVRRMPTGTPNEALRSFLTLLPGVSASAAEVVASRFDGPASLCGALRDGGAACVDDIAAILNGKRRVGPAAAARIASAFWGVVPERTRKTRK